MNQLRFINQVIYSLKRQYGGPVDLYRNTIGATDLTTGKKHNTRTKWHIKKALRLPRDIHQNALFGATGNRLFQYGNFIEVADRVIIIDTKDLPSKSFVIGQENWYVIIDQIHYEIVKSTAFDFNAAWHLVLKAVSGTPPDNIVEISVGSGIGVGSEVDLT